MRIGTWITRSALNSADETARALAELGIEHGSIMINDFGGARSPRPFETHDHGAIVNLANRLRQHDMTVSLTTWVMPRREFLEGLLEQVTSLATRCDASMVVLDAEEPWTKAIAPMDLGKAAHMLSHLPGTKCLTGIANVNASWIEPLAEICEVWSPQAYATTRPRSLKPDRAVDHALSKWRAAFGEPDRWMIGLACYSQPVPASTYMQPVLDHAEAARIDDVCYWSHKRILQRPDVAAVISGASDEPEPVVREGGIMGELDIEAMPSDTVDDAVGQFQALLAWAAKRSGNAAVDPGKIDGRPGPKTLAALDAFNEASGIPVESGRAVGQTWWELLRS